MSQGKDDSEALKRLVLQQHSLKDHLDRFVQAQVWQLKQHQNVIETHLRQQREQVEELVWAALRSRKEVQLGASSLNEVLAILTPHESDRTSSSESGLCLKSALSCLGESKLCDYERTSSVISFATSSEKRGSDDASSAGRLVHPPARLRATNSSDSRLSEGSQTDDLIMLGFGEVEASSSTSWEADSVQQFATGTLDIGPHQRSRSRLEAKNEVRSHSRRQSERDAACRLTLAYVQAAQIAEERLLESPGLSDNVFDHVVSWIMEGHHYCVNTRLAHWERIETAVESKHFKIAVVVLIALNALYVGVTTDLSMKSSIETFRNQSDNLYADILRSNLVFGLDVCFNATFFAELMVRILSQGGKFWCGPEWNWNLFDTVVVGLSFVEMSLLAVGFSSSYIRVLRLARVVRSLRMIRIVRFLSLFNKLHAISLAFARCRTMLICAVLCLCLVVFVFSIIFNSAVAAYISDTHYDDGRVDDMETFFGSLSMTMLTLFMTVSGGVDWWDICELLMEVGGGFVLIFLCFITITVLAVLNVINAIFVNDAVDATQHDLDLRSEADLAEHRAMISRFTRIFHEMEKDRRDLVSVDAFVRHMETQQVKAQLSLIGVHFCDCVTLFRFLDVDDTHFLTIDQFVMGCLRLNSKITTIEMSVELKTMKSIVTQIQETLNALVAQEQVGVNDLCQV